MSSYFMQITEIYFSWCIWVVQLQVKLNSMCSILHGLLEAHFYSSSFQLTFSKYSLDPSGVGFIWNTKKPFTNDTKSTSSYFLVAISNLSEVAHRGWFWGPAGWTDLSMALHELESLNEAQCLLNRTAYWKVVDAHVFDDAIRIDDKQPPTWGKNMNT